MGRNSLYSEKQWRWVEEKYIEGCTVSELAEFLDLDITTLSHRFKGLKRADTKRCLPKLNELKREFYALWSD